MKLVCGIDEAGKGSVIGPLIIAGILIEEKKIDKLKKIGVRDSKLLSHKRRIEISKKIKRIIKNFEIIKVYPKEIDNALDGNNALNLNWLEAIKTAQIINKLNPDKAIIDCPSPNLAKYKGYVKKLLRNELELIVEHKADNKFLSCAAASILAKVTREEEVELIKMKYGNIGPGYPSNEITKKFIKENFEKHPEIFRKSWATWKHHKKLKEQKKLGDF